MPALMQAMSSMRLSDSNLSQRSCTPSSVARSARTSTTLAPMAASFCAAESRRSPSEQMTRSYPRPANSFASENPIPLDAPVTNASLSPISHLLRSPGVSIFRMRSPPRLFGTTAPSIKRIFAKELLSSPWPAAACCGRHRCRRVAVHVRRNDLASNCASYRRARVLGAIERGAYPGGSSGKAYVDPSPRLEICALSLEDTDRAVSFEDRVVNLLERPDAFRPRDGHHIILCEMHFFQYLPLPLAMFQQH